MPTSIQLVERMTQALRYPMAEVRKHDRHLLERRFRTTGGRGISAAHMTSADAASLLGSIMAAPANNDSLQKSPDAWLRYRDLPCARRLQKTEPDHPDTQWQTGIEQLDALAPGHTALAAMAAAIECSTQSQNWTRGAADQAWRAVHPDNIVIDFHAPLPMVDIRVWNATTGRDEFHRYFDEAAFGDTERLPGIRQRRTVYFDVLLQLGQLLKG